VGVSTRCADTPAVELYKVDPNINYSNNNVGLYSYVFSSVNWTAKHRKPAKTSFRRRVRTIVSPSNFSAAYA